MIIFGIKLASGKFAMIKTPNTVNVKIINVDTFKLVAAFLSFSIKITLFQKI